MRSLKTEAFNVVLDFRSIDRFLFDPFKRRVCGICVYERFSKNEEWRVISEEVVDKPRCTTYVAHANFKNGIWFVFNKNDCLLR